MIGHLVRRAQLIGELAVDAAVALLYVTGALRDPSRPDPIPARVPVAGCDCGRSDDLTDYHQHDVTCTVWDGHIRRTVQEAAEPRYSGGIHLNGPMTLSVEDQSVFRSGGQTKEYGPRPRIAASFPSRSSSVGVGLQPPTEESPESPSPDVETQGTPNIGERPWEVADLTNDWFLPGCLPGGILDSWGVVIGRFDTLAQAQHVVDAVNQKK